MHRRMYRDLWVIEQSYIHSQSRLEVAVMLDGGHTGVTVLGYSVHGKLGRDNFVIDGVC